jgi:hypothetical protein
VLAPAASAKSQDRNHDRIPDTWEKHHHLSLRVNEANKDQDHDGMRNLAEFRAGTDPRDADTDNNGVNDGREDSGTVVTFANGTLTLKLFRDNATVVGTVDDQTEFKCPMPAGTQPASVRDHGDGGGDGATTQSGDNATMQSGDDNGDQATQSGDDNGDQATQSGDDNGVDANDDNVNDANGAANANPACGTDQLKAGTVVHEAELSTTPTGLHFDEIKLGAPPSSPAA